MLTDTFSFSLYRRGFIRVVIATGKVKIIKLHYDLQPRQVLWLSESTRQRKLRSFVVIRPS